jgi:hypothetical protein
MKSIRIFLAILAVGCGLASTAAFGQSTRQNLYFSLYGQYVKTTTNEALHVENSTFRSVLIDTANVVRAIIVDEFGPEYVNWTSSSLLLRINANNGEEGIFLNNGAQEHDVSKYFTNSYGLCFSNHFTTQLGLAFPGLIQNFTSNNPSFSNTNSSGAVVINSGVTNTSSEVAKHVQTAGTYFISLATSNLQFNLFGVSLALYGDGLYTDIKSGTNNVLLFDGPMNVLGAFQLNTQTNLLVTPPTFYSGPMRGIFTLYQPILNAKITMPSNSP